MKRRYIFKEFCEAALADLQADLASQRANEKRALVLQANKESDGIEENIKRVAAEDAGKEISPKEKYENDRERNEAEKIVASKRQFAKQQEEEAKGSDDTVKMFRKQAAKSREVAERLRRL